jgi:Lipase maturation factor/DCC1-like thiol-disulfide oxidoreductase
LADADRRAGRISSLPGSGSRFPSHPSGGFQQAIQLIDADGKVYSGAAAAFRVVRLAPGRAAWWWCYTNLPGFAPVSEWAYAFFAQRRGLLNRFTKLLWGPALQAERYALVSWVFLRLFGLIYVAAFASLGVQILGLIGHAGILPLGDFLVAARAALGGTAYWILPTLFWMNAGDTALIAGTVAGVVLGLLVVANKFTRPALIGLYLLYLSYVYAGQAFMSFQWDSLLLEVGFLAIFLAGGSRIVVWLFRCLVFRYMFMSGIVKLLSGDPTWHDLTALEYHFWTQPLPTPLAWYVAQLPPRRSRTRNRSNRASSAHGRGRGRFRVRSLGLGQQRAAIRILRQTGIDERQNGGKRRQYDAQSHGRRGLNDGVARLDPCGGMRQCAAHQ